MSTLNPKFTLHEDVRVSNEETIALHGEYIKSGKYEEAKALLDKDTSMNNKGIRASFFNWMETKIKELQIYLLNKTAAPDEYYSLTEPTNEFMKENGYIFWIKPIE